MSDNQSPSVWLGELLTANMEPSALLRWCLIQAFFGKTIHTLSSSYGQPHRRLLGLA